ncbi:FkbM family methyltransferase [Methanocaldococcus lauensis]|uniref:FkbM family methyltransferase n=1 Tax=Methanocaldococcus lauensis TaxID=2546128 RepID=UPI001BDCB225|nr:FkbM family methyltransferase [Methanocaldococcus lauensis]
MEEIFIYEVYKYLKNLKCILELGGFLGESAVYLAMNGNKRVVTFEPDPKNFKYLIKNVSQFDNIEYYNFAVVNRKKHGSSELLYYKSDEFDYGGNLYGMYDKKHKIKIRSVGIDEIIDKYNFDGIKMDIEGCEFEIIEYFMENKNKFNFCKGYIEIHFEGKNEDNMKIFRKFINFLENNGYKYKIYKDNKEMSLSNILHLYNNLSDKKWLIFVLYFEKL